MADVKSIGILGAGKLGMTVAQLAAKAGYKVFISGSGAPKKIALSVQVLVPGAVATTSQKVAEQADVVILALPLGNYRQIPHDSLAGKLVVDAMNYWWEVDGPRDDFIDPNVSSSEAVQSFLSNSRIVKGLNHMGYHDLFDEPRAAGQPGRKAIALAGDNLNDVAVVAEIINKLGFDPITIGKLADGIKLEPGNPAFGANEEKILLRTMVANTKTSA